MPRALGRQPPIVCERRRRRRARGRFGCCRRRPRAASPLVNQRPRTAVVTSSTSSLGRPDGVPSRRSRNVVGPAIALAVAGVAAGALAAIGVFAGADQRKERRWENAKHIVKRLFEEPWTGNFDAIHEFISPDYVGHDPAVPEPIRGPAGAPGEPSERYIAGFPGGADHRSTSRSPRASKVATRWTRVAERTRASSQESPRPGRTSRSSGLTISRSRGRKGRRGVDDLGHVRDARPAGRDSRARPRVAADNQTRHSGRPAGGLPLLFCRVSEPPAVNTSRRRSEMSSFFTSQHMPCAECGASVRTERA